MGATLLLLGSMLDELLLDEKLFELLGCSNTAELELP